MADGDTKGKYEQFWGFQEAVNKAVEEKRAIRFVCTMSNDEIRKKLRFVDKKGCKIHKPDKNSHDIAVIPPEVVNFDFNEVDTKIVVQDKRILLPGKDF